MQAIISVQLKGPVGKDKLNRPADVRLVQRLLNQQIRLPFPYLTEDGIFGSKTGDALRRFQVNICSMQQPTAQVEPGDATFNRLIGLHDAGAHRSPSAAAALLKPSQSPLKRALEPYSQAMREEFAHEHREEEFSDFWFILEGTDHQITAFYSVIGSVDTARKLVRFYLTLRALNRGAGDMVKLLGALHRAPLETRALFLEIWTEPMSRASKMLEKVSSIGDIIALMLLVPKYIKLVQDKQWGNAAAEVYKCAMGIMVPWGGVIDAIQSTYEWKFGKSSEGSRAFKIMRSVNPVALGGVAIDSVVTMINVCVGSSNEAEFDRLVERMKRGPAQVFAEFGEKLGDKLFDLLHRG